jgi:hypothetical protein
MTHLRAVLLAAVAAAAALSWSGHAAPQHAARRAPAAAASIAHAELLDALVWLRDDVYPDVVGHPLDDSGLASWFGQHYVGLRYAGVGHEEAKRTVRALIVAAAPPRPAPIDPAPEPAPSRIHGRLRVQDGRLANDAGWFAWQGISEFSAIHLVATGREAELVRRLDRAAAAGRNGIRVLGMARHLFELSPAQPGYLAALDRVLELAAARGLYVELCVFADAQDVMPDAGERRAWLRALAGRYRDDPRILWQIANEARKNGWREADDDALISLARDLATVLGHRDFSISDPLDGDDEAATADMLARFERLARESSILVLHGSRKEDGARVRWVEHLKGFRDVVAEIQRRVGRPLYGIHDEPMGAAAAREPGRRDNRAAAHAAAAYTAAVLGLGYTYHYIAEQSDATPGLDLARGAASLAPSPDYRYTNANLAGSWIGSFDGYSKIRPAHNDVRGVAVGLGSARGRVDFRGWRAAELVHYEADGLVVTVWEAAK